MLWLLLMARVGNRITQITFQTGKETIVQDFEIQVVILSGEDKNLLNQCDPNKFMIISFNFATSRMHDRNRGLGSTTYFEHDIHVS